MVNDIGLIKNIELLFERENIIWGCGNYGKELVDLFETAGIPVSYICDRDEEKKLRKYQMIVPEQLKKIKNMEEVNIVVGSMAYADEIVDWIQQEGISYKNLFSVGGIYHAIALNIDSVYFDSVFRRWFRMQQYIDSENWETRGFVSMTKRLFLLFHIYNSSGVIVYQSGKVGSNTVYGSLERYKVPCLHLHTLKYFGNNQYLIEDYLRNTSFKTKIITLVREPISREIAFYFEWMSHKFIRGDVVNKDIVAGLKDYLEREENNRCTEEFAWFDEEIRHLTGIDIFQYDFNREKGYGVIREGKWEILVLKLEKLDLAADIIGEFVGVSDFTLENVNIGSEKLYRYTYAEAKKRLKISDKMIKKYYDNNERLRHFYTEDEIDSWKRKYQ